VLVEMLTGKPPDEKKRVELKRERPVYRLPSTCRDTTKQMLDEMFTVEAENRPTAQQLLERFFQQPDAQGTCIVVACCQPKAPPKKMCN
jgi:hypothetical protein